MNLSKGWFISTLLSVIVALIIGYFIGKNSSNFSDAKPSKQKIKEGFSESRTYNGYKYINPLLECDNYRPSELATMVKLENELQNYINHSLSKATSSHISVYVRLLNNGPWIGIDENYPYSPASLLKVPIMIAALKKAETEPGFLQKKIKYTELQDKEFVPNIKDDIIKLGNSYTIEELITRMVKNSDNEAKELILKEVGDNEILKCMNEMGVITEGVDLGKDFISVKTYSSFFRLLYNATYLNKTMSEKALEILSTTSFTIGLPARLPKEIIVSHKFGERGYVDTNLKQLHDCGIVYAPGNPYLICVMTKGDSFDELAKVIADISLITYRSIIESVKSQ